MTTVVTSWHPAGYGEYGRQFLTSFERHWPSDVGLFVFLEDDGSSVDVPTRAKIRSQWDCPGLKKFLERHKDNAEAAGKGPSARWPEKWRKNGYCYRFDAIKFCKQLFVPEAVARELPDGEVLVWLDGDVVTTDTVPADLLETLLGDSDVSYLGRRGTHSEIGYWSVRLSADTREFLTWLADCFRRDTVFNMSEWHSAFVWDRCRERFEKKGGKARNLTPDGHGHVFTQSALNPYLDHLKGRRKALGRSPERR